MKIYHLGDWAAFFKFDVDPKLTILTLVGGTFIVVLFSGSYTLLFAAPIRYVPSVTVSERYDDNIFLVPQGKTSDFITILEPQLRISYAADEIADGIADKVVQHVRYSAMIERYAEADELNTVKHFADLNWTAQVARTARIRILNRFAFTPDSTEISEVGVAVPRGDVLSNDATVGFQVSGFDLSYQFGLQGYENSELSDSRSHTVQERIMFPLSVRYSITQSYRLRYFIQEKEITLRSHTAGAGLRYHFSPRFQVGLEGGVVYWRRLGDDSFQSDPMARVSLDRQFRRLKLGLSYLHDIRNQWEGSLEYELRNTVLRLSYSRELAAGGGVFEGAVDRQSVTAHLQQSIDRDLGIHLMGAYSSHDRLGNDSRGLESYRGEAGLTYSLLSWLNTRVLYSFIRQDAETEGDREFTRHQGTLSLTATLN